MEAWKTISITLGYLGLLFWLAHFIDQRAKTGKHIIPYKWIYALSIPVYCTAWTFYGSVGKAVNDGWEFLTIYIGPLLTMPLWWIIVRKMIRICEVQRISTLPDFLASRYGKSLSISVISSLLIIFGIIPYISIQLKSITGSFEMLTFGSYQGTSSSAFFFNDSAFYLTIILALFIVLFVFRSIETTDKHYGMMGAIAADSIIKLVAFLAVGIFVTYGLFDGFEDIFSKADDVTLSKFLELPTERGFEWFFLLLLSMSAIILLPRQFQVTIAENDHESHLKTSMWLFPLYLLLINIFVVPIALGGGLLLPSSVDPDSYMLAIPLMKGQSGLAAFTFIGGFSAATGMIIVSAISLSLITSNNIIVPIILKGSESRPIYSTIPLRSRRIAVFGILILAYLYYKLIADRFPLVSIGLISFAAMIQFAPSTLGALFWKDANKKGALSGIIIGFIIWAYTLVVPTMVEVRLLPESLMTEGLFGIQWFKPESLFGANLSPIAHGTFWSLFFNVCFFFAGSLLGRQTAKERNMAELFVDIYQHSSLSEQKLVWKGDLIHQDLISLSENLLGKERTNQALRIYEKTYGKFEIDERIDSRFVNYIERLLSGAIGSASARILISSIAKEEEIEIHDVIHLLKETSETAQLNKELQIKSDELKRRTDELEAANERLKNIDKEKDDFISTVTHELRTPLTSIKAFVEIIQDNPELSERNEFLDTINEEIDRMTRLINQVLDMEKLESGAIGLDKQSIIPFEIIEDSLSSIHHLLKSKNIELVQSFSSEARSQILLADEDRLKQVFINLFSNAINHSKDMAAQIEVIGKSNGKVLEIAIRDNGKGIKPENLNHIFDKFFQARNQTTKKPKGTGLGLSITKKIIELHDGAIDVQSVWEEGSTFTIKLPIKSN